MVVIQHCSASKADLVPKHTKNVKIKLNRKLIEEDIAKWKGRTHDTDNKVDKKNVQGIIDYLNKLLRVMSKDADELEIMWNADGNGVPISYPVQFKTEPLYKFDSTNYIELASNQSLVNVDIKLLADILAYSFIFREYGESHESIEELLKDCSLTGYNEPKVFQDMFAEYGDEPYYQGRGLIISDSPFLSTDGEMEIYDYFYTSKFKVGSRTQYAEVIDYSCKYAASIVANSIAKKCEETNTNVSIISIEPTTISLIVDGKGAESIGDIIESVLIKVFSRRFKIKPIVQIV